MEYFPQVVLKQLVYLLNPNDIISLGLSSKTMHALFMSNEVWKSKTIHDFGNLFNVYAILTTATGLDLAPDLAHKFTHEPSNWCHYYLKKNASISETDNEALMEQADKEYYEAQYYLKTYQNDGNILVLSQVASKMMWILDIFPAHAGSYYILGFALFVLNRLEEAMILLQMAHAVDPGFEPVDELEKEIQKIMDGYKERRCETQLLTNDYISPALAAVLTEIFQSFDKDKDGALCPDELDSFVFATNGSHPPATFLREMGERFGCNAEGGLTKDGFMVSFYD
ncbi:hypothetical protein DFQ28_011615 [Apophysomyces sp. BC1034]|nr:hypothetical protein DFQ30_011483 [Apophysomyces sp. BC1015]KAG0168812.1 hypothetical protein DFQ29_010010 [Apophysomyces sp. BC1021]KAG0184197.1 hypothetical protein DFQ28_011615 [Apophysomyces sp. BC1034]